MPEGKKIARMSGPASYLTFQHAELVTARNLVAVSPRAAGALAGVVLEGHLKTVVEARQLRFMKKAPTIGDLNDSLRNADVYDLSIWRKISYLADLRNLCTHSRVAEPTAGQASELIEGLIGVSDFAV